MKIGTRLYRNLALAIGLTIVLALILVWFSYETRKELGKSIIAVELVRETTDLTVIGEEFLVYRYPRTLMQWKSKYASTMAVLKILKGSYEDHRIRKNLIILNESFLKLSTNYLKTRALREKKLSEESIILDERLSGQMRLLSRNIVGSALKISEKASGQVSRIQQKGTTAIFIFLVILILLTTAVSRSTIRRITTPLAALVRDANMINSGNLKHRISTNVCSPSKNRDEIEDLSQSFSSMTENLVESITKLKLEVTKRTEAETELQKAHDSLEQRVEERTAELAKANDRLKKEIDERKQTEEVLKQKTYNLNERVKELNCLFGVSNLVENPDNSLEEVFQGIVDLIPASWQYPEITCSRIIFKDKEFKTEIFKETNWKQSREIFVTGKQMGVLEVCYLEKRPEIDEGPFLNEERSLINAISERLGRIIERKQANEALKNEKLLSDDYINSLPGLFYVFDEKRFVRWNREWNRITGYSDEELSGMYGTDFFEGEDRTLIGKQMLKVFREGIAEAEVKLITKDSRGISYYFTGIRKKLGGKDHLIGLGIDITGRKKLETQLQQSQKMEAIATLAGGIAHQFNNSLMPITANIEMLEMDFTGDKNLKNYTRQMKGSAERMAMLTDQLLAYAKGGKYQPGILSVSDFMRDTLPLIRHTIGTAVQVDTDIPHDVFRIEADMTQMQMVLSAVMINASEAMEGRGSVQVIFRNETITDETVTGLPYIEPGDYVKLTIEDEGKGMDEVTRSRIFEPFFTTKVMGRGLGMAAVYGIIKNHDGWIYVDSEFGKGTGVYIYLPAVEVPVEKPGKPKPEAVVPKGTGTILVIEDEEMVMDVTTLLLEKLGYRVLGAKTGKEAISITKTFEGHIDLAILDIILPDMGGKAIYPIIMKARPNLKVIVYSGYSIEGPAQEILDAGAEAFIQKPFRIKEISEKLEKVLEGK